jgi:signal transduction histidine kinase
MSAEGSRLPSDWFSTRVSVAIWTVPTLISSLETVTFARQNGHPIAFWRAFVGEAPQWYCWALLTPVIVALGERAPLRPPLRARNVAIHIIASLMASAIGAVADATVNAWVRPNPRGVLASTASWFVGNLAATTLAYFAILGVSYAISGNARLRERERQAAELETQLRNAQLAALRMQLQPHFLFNSLNAIMGLVRDHDSERAIHALRLLSDVLRATVSAGADHETTLARELDFVSQYLEIERVRFGDRLGIRIDVPDELAGARVPPFILQPFVENSLKHGVLRDRGANEIRISASAANGTLHLAVHDDGRGLSETWTSTEGVGISNARARLSRMYGEAARITVGNSPAGRGVAVDIALPHLA